MEESRKKSRFRIIWNKITRPWCSGNRNGGHTMVEYRVESKKKCCDCDYSERIYTKES